jgi:Fur family peroxide stress response transcriptional regulator
LTIPKNESNKIRRIREAGRLGTIFREQGARVTPQRIAILRAVEAAGSHPDAEAVYRHVSREYPHISRDTVYRTLAMMEKKRIIGSVLFVGNSKRYDPKIGRHHHLICTRCKKIVDFSATKFDNLSAPSAVVEGFRVLRTSVVVEAVCLECVEEMER